MPAESQEKAVAATADAVPGLPPLKLVPAPFAFLLALAWIAIGAALVVLEKNHPRDPEDLIVWILGALFLAYPLAWIGFSVWRNRHGFRAWGWLRRALGGLRILLQPVYWFLGILIPTSFALPMNGDYTVRAKMSELVLAASGFKTTIAEQAHVKGTLAESGVGLSVTPGGKVTVGLVSRDGVIVLYNGEFRMLVTLVPELLKDANVKWSCDAMLKKFFPAECRSGETSHGWRERGSSSEDAEALLRRGVAWQQEVARVAVSQGVLAGSAKTTIVRREGLVDFGLLDTNGRIALYSDRHGTFALLEPDLKEARITWRCRIWPETAAPSGCSPAQ